MSILRSVCVFVCVKGGGGAMSVSASVSCSDGLWEEAICESVCPGFDGPVPPARG